MTQRWFLEFHPRSLVRVCRLIWVTLEILKSEKGEMEDSVL